VPAVITGSALRTCFGDELATFTALISGRSGAAELSGFDTGRLNLTHGYPITAAGPGDWLADCVQRALRDADVDPAAQRVVAIVGTGLRELALVERPAEVGADRLDFGAAVRQAVPAVTEVLTVSNACSAAGHALALAQDLIELGDADVVVVGGTDGMTESMLTMIGRVADEPTTQVRPFDAERTGVLLGDGAAAVVLTREGASRPLGRLLATGLSCDASPETAPDPDGIARAMRDAFERAGRTPEEVGLVLAHGTGTALNDPAEAAALNAVFGEHRPLVTAVKGAVGHTSGASALTSLVMAVECLRQSVVFPVAGLRKPCAEADGLDLVIGDPVRACVRLAQVDSFGFGGVNAVTLIEAAR
jgi:3-oxoacyl-[acyl-carrier-protein] synthase II